MSALPSIALSGMTAAQASLEARAHNLANLGTDGFRRSTTLRTALADGGVASRPARLDSPGHALAADLVGQVQDRHAFLANLSVFRTHDAMTGALLDAVG
jgi:Flagella basal body rod protein